MEGIVPASLTDTQIIVWLRQLLGVQRFNRLKPLLMPRICLLEVNAEIPLSGTSVDVTFTKCTSLVKEGVKEACSILVKQEGSKLS